MKKSVFALCTVVALAATTLFAQTLTVPGTGQEQATASSNGYDYELWSQYGTGSSSLTVTASATNGGTFTGSWNNTLNVLIRAGKKFKNNETVSSVGNVAIDFEASWQSNDGARMISVYGWGYYPSGPYPFPDRNTDQIEYYIFQTRGSYNSATQGTNCRAKGSSTIDNIKYNFSVCDRNGQPSLTGSTNFIQYFSYPANTNDHRLSGHISVSEHFKAWAANGMPMNKLYEVALKVESYTGGNDGKGTTTVSKNILCIGNSCSTSAQSSSSGSTQSRSSSSGGTNPSVSSSSTVVTTSSSSGTGSGSGNANPTCTDYDTDFCGGAAFAEVTAGTANTIPSTGECVYIGNFDQIEGDLAGQGANIKINGTDFPCEGPESNAAWEACKVNATKGNKPALKDGGYYVFVERGNINAYSDTYTPSNGWGNVVAKPKPECGAGGDPSSSSGEVSPIRLPQIAVENMVSQMNGGIYLQAANNAVVEIFSLSGKKMSRQTFSNGTYSISLGHLPKGMYVVKVSFGSQRKTLNVPVL